MEKLIKSVLIVIITFITLLAMNKFAIPKGVDAVKMDEDGQTNIQKNEDTGYIFDESDKEINIKLKDGKTKINNDEQNNNSENSGSGLNNNIQSNNEYANKNNNEGYNNDSPQSNNFDNLNRTFDEQSNNYFLGNKTVEQYEKLLSIDDKLVLLNLAKKFSIEDLSKMKYVIDNGEYDNNSINQLNQLVKSKVSNEDYEKILQLVQKYKK